MPVPESPIAGTHKGRRVLRKPGDAHRPAHRLGDRLVALEVAIGAVGAEALDRGIDQPRVESCSTRHSRSPAGPARPARNSPAARRISRSPRETAPCPRPVFRLRVRLRLLALNSRKNRLSLSGRSRMLRRATSPPLGSSSLITSAPRKAEDLRAGGPRLVVRHVDDANARKRLAHIDLLDRLARSSLTLVGYGGQSPRAGF